LRASYGPTGYGPSFFFFFGKESPAPRPKGREKSLGLCHGEIRDPQICVPFFPRTEGTRPGPPIFFFFPPENSGGAVPPVPPDTNSGKPVPVFLFSGPGPPGLKPNKAPLGGPAAPPWENPDFPWIPSKGAPLPPGINAYRSPRAQGCRPLGRTELSSPETSPPRLGWSWCPLCPIDPPDLSGRVPPFSDSPGVPPTEPGRRAGAGPWAPFFFVLHAGLSQAWFVPPPFVWVWPQAFGPPPPNLVIYLQSPPIPNRPPGLVPLGWLVWSIHKESALPPTPAHLPRSRSWLRTPPFFARCGGPAFFVWCFFNSGISEVGPS